MESLTPILNTEFLGNTMQSYTEAVFAFVLFAIVFKFIQYVILNRLAKLSKKTKTDIDDTLIKIVRSLKPAFYYFVAFYFASKFLIISPLIVQIINGILVAWVVYQIIISIQILIDYALEKKLNKSETDDGTKAAIKYVSNILKVALWLLGILLLLSNLGVNITSLVAGLGIGGIAIAFALQNILGDLFSSFAIFFDKPFQTGEFIVVGESAGTVEKIGIKTTRIRSTTGEELIISNQELTSARIKNYKRLKERRALFTIGVLYETPTDTLRKIPSIIKDIITSVSKARFDRVHFREFADSSLNYEISFYVESSEYQVFLDVQQEVSMQIMEVFAKEGIDFAYPTQTLYIQK